MSKIEREELSKGQVIKKMTFAQFKIVSTWLWNLSKTYRPHILIYTVLGILNVGLGLFGIWLTKTFIDIATNDVEGSFFWTAFSIVALMIFQLLQSYFTSYFVIKFSTQFNNEVRIRLFSSLLNSRWSDVDNFHTGDLLTRVKQDMGQAVNFLSTIFPSLIITVTQLIASFLFLLYLDKMLAIIILCITPVLFLFSKFYVVKMRKYSLQIKDTGSDLNALLQENVQHLSVIKTLEHQDDTLKSINNMQDNLLALVLRQTRFSLKVKNVMSLGFSSGYLVAFIWGVFQLSLSLITFGTLTAFLQLAGRIQAPISGLMSMLPKFINVYTSIERVLEIEEMQKEDTRASIVMDGSLSLSLSKLSFSYRETPLFEDFNLRFEAGKMTALIGETGCGKTTVMRLLLDLVSPDKGEVLMSNGLQTIQISARTRSNIIYVPQGNSLFSGTIKDNLLMGNPNATQADMEQVLQVAEANFVFDLPKGIHTQLQEFGQGLSEGQAQRIGIARSLLRKGNILLLDEVTSALDEVTELNIIKNLKVYTKGKTIIVITHRTKFLEFCDEVIRM